MLERETKKNFRNRKIYRWLIASSPSRHWSSWGVWTPGPAGAAGGCWDPLGGHLGPAGTRWDPLGGLSWESGLGPGNGHFSHFSPLFPTFRPFRGVPRKVTFRTRKSEKVTEKNAANTSARWDVLKKWFRKPLVFSYTPFPRSWISGFFTSRIRTRKMTLFSRLACFTVLNHTF